MSLRVALASLLLSTSLLIGCDNPPPRTAAAGGEARPEVVDRHFAIASARRDAALQYGGDAWIERTDAHQFGRYWVVELRAKDGAVVRYAISTRTGAIQERALLQ
jgi:hypothetical protein